MKFFWCVAWFGMVSPLFGQIRTAEPLVVPGSSLAAFQGSPVEQLHLYALVDGGWQVIPFQFDEKSADNSYFEPDNGVVDGNDELVFQPQDGGDIASFDNWPDEPSFYVFPRINIAVSDPVEGGTVYAYLFRSGSLPPATLQGYVDYDATGDRILADDYEIGFDDVLMFWNELRIFRQGQFSNDLLDREKYRIEGFLFPVPYSFSEEDITPVELLAKSGPIRVIRRFQGQISLLTFDIPIVLERHFYRHFIGLPLGQSLEIPDGTGVNSIRYSVDFSAEAIGTTVSDPNNAQLTVDGVPDSNVQTSLTPAQQDAYWIRLEYQGAALINAGRFAGVAMDPRFFYHDDANGSAPPDGTSDTGDMVAYGDSGVHLIDPIPGPAQVGFNAYIDPDGLLGGPQVASWLGQPLMVQTSAHEGLDLLLSLWPQEGVSNVLAMIEYVTNGSSLDSYYKNR